MVRWLPITCCQSRKALFSAEGGTGSCEKLPGLCREKRGSHQCGGEQESAAAALLQDANKLIAMPTWANHISDVHNATIAVSPVITDNAVRALARPQWVRLLLVTGGCCCCRC